MLTHWMHKDSVNGRTACCQLKMADLPWSDQFSSGQIDADCEGPPGGLAVPIADALFSARGIDAPWNYGSTGDFHWERMTSNYKPRDEL